MDRTLEPIGTGSEMDVQALGGLAQALLDERDQIMRRVGGVTPEQLQAMCTSWGQAVNDNFSVRSVPQILTDLAKEYHVIHDDGHEATIQEWCAALTLLAMHISGVNVFDLYEATYQYMGETLENVTVLAREDRERKARRDATR